VVAAAFASEELELPSDLPDKWRDEDGFPPPHVERTVEWWKRANDDGWINDAVDAVLMERGVYAPTPPAEPQPRRVRLGRTARTGSELSMFAYFRARRHRLVV
jgi:hypothetical protein